MSYEQDTLLLFLFLNLSRIKNNVGCYGNVISGGKEKKKKTSVVKIYVKKIVTFRNFDYSEWPLIDIF